MSDQTKTIGRDLPNGDYIEITAELRGEHGPLSPGFAITATMWEKRGTWSGRAARRNGREAHVAGCIHDQILSTAPELTPIVTAHLADPDGTPMHAVANGWYFYSGGAAAYERAQIAAGKDYGYSRMLERSDRERAAQALNVAPENVPEDMSEAEFKTFAANLADTWARQAADARATLNAMIDGDGIEDVLS